MHKMLWVSLKLTQIQFSSLLLSYTPETRLDSQKWHMGMLPTVVLSHIVHSKPVLDLAALTDTSLGFVLEKHLYDDALQFLDVEN